jgi:alpha-glucosidase
MYSKSMKLLLVLLLGSTMVFAQKEQSFEVKSFDGEISLKVNAGKILQWAVIHKGKTIIEPSTIALELEGGEVLGKDLKIKSSEATSNNSNFKAVNYKKSLVEDRYNQLVVTFKNDFSVSFRVYNDGVAYRFFTTKKGEIIIKNEVANFNFSANHKAFVPYMWDYRDDLIFNNSFEAEYEEANISEFRKDSLAFLPLMVDAGNNIKVVILEADLENYPGMYLDINETNKGFKGVFAPYPLDTRFGGYENMNVIPTKRANYIAVSEGKSQFPWRAVVISEKHTELLNNDMVQKLASPCRIEDPSWIVPGQVSWDYWNDWNISHVDFKSGMNNETYEYYIDFASANNIPYIIVDWGWSSKRDLFDLNEKIDLKKVVDYGKNKNVGVIIWASWHATTQQMDKAFPYYAEMGVKGFKIDFIDRDDQIAVASLYEIAQKAAENELIINYHGVYKPTGLNRTYPNVVNYEGVKGLENMKWADYDAMRYDVTIPYIRMLAGPMDYTPGAMRNATKENFVASNSRPMSKGTRAHQVAMYVVFDAPLQMLADDPTTYMREQESTDFIVKVPTIYDETVALDGKVGEYVALARRKGNTWFVGAMGNWDEHTLELDFSFLGKGNYKAVVFKDGVNANRDATDYKVEEIIISSSDKLKIDLSNGGGWAARIEKVK